MRPKHVYDPGMEMGHTYVWTYVSHWPGSTVEIAAVIRCDAPCCRCGEMKHLGQAHIRLSVPELAADLPNRLMICFDCNHRPPAD